MARGITPLVSAAAGLPLGVTVERACESIQSPDRSFLPSYNRQSDKLAPAEKLGRGSITEVLPQWYMYLRDYNTLK